MPCGEAFSEFSENHFAQTGRAKGGQLVDDRVANLLFSWFQVHGIVPAWLSMFPILLMSSIATLFWRWAQKKERERTIVCKGETIIVLSLT